MARQLGLDVVVLEVPSDRSAAAGQIEVLAAGALERRQALSVRHAARTADSRQGGQGRRHARRPAGRSRTAAAARSRRFDTYPITADQLKHVTAHVVADPFDLSRRAAAIESKLSGDDRLALTVSPSAFAEKLKAVPGITGVELWDFPFRTIRDQLRVPIEARREMAVEFEPFAWRPTLWKARVLHFQGHKSGDVDAPNANLDEVVDDQARGDRPLHQSAGAAARSRPQRARFGAEEEDLLRGQRRRRAIGSACCSSTRENTTRRRIGSAIRGWPPKRAATGPTARATTSPAPTRPQGKNAEAIKLYEADDSPQRDGNRLRARWLQEQAAARRARQQPLERLNRNAGSNPRPLVPAGAGGPAGRRHDVAGHDAAVRRPALERLGRGDRDLHHGPAARVEPAVGRGSPARCRLARRLHECRRLPAAGLARQPRVAAGAGDRRDRGDRRSLHARHRRRLDAPRRRQRRGRLSRHDDHQSRAASSSCQAGCGCFPASTPTSTIGPSSMG